MAQLAEQPVSAKFYTIANRFLCVQAFDKSSSQFVEQFLSTYHFALVSACEVEQVDHLLLRVRCAAPPPLPFDLRQFEIERGYCYTNGKRWYLNVDDSLVVLDDTAFKVIDIWFGKTARAQHPAANFNVLSYAIPAVLRRCGLYPIHAAGVFNPEQGAGALIIGDSGSGKSTLTIRLAACGWRYLSDDVLVLVEERAGVEIWGLRRVFAIAETTLAACELPRLEKAVGGPILSDPTKRRLEPGVVFPDGFAQSCVPRTLFFPVITGDAVSRIVKLSRSEAMVRLIKQCPWSSYETSVVPDYLRVVGRLVKQSDAYVLLAGRDILSETKRAAEILAAHMKK